MKKVVYKVGMIVEHPKRPQWGPGKIIAVVDDRVTVAFRDDPERTVKTIVTSVVQLGIGKVQMEQILDQLPPAVRAHGKWVLPKIKKLHRRVIPSQGRLARSTKSFKPVKPGNIKRQVVPRYRQG